MEWGCITGRPGWATLSLDTELRRWHWRIPARMAPQTGPSEKGTGPVPAFPQLFTWEEVGIRNGRGQGQEQWLVIDRKVYDVSKFSKRHPGGSRVISHYAGQDATVRAGKAVGGRWFQWQGRRTWWESSLVVVVTVLGQRAD